MSQMLNVINYCGFETGDLTEVASTSGAVAMDSTTVMEGRWSCKVTLDGATTNWFRCGEMQADGSEAVALVSGAVDELYTSFYFYVSSNIGVGSECIYQVRNQLNQIKHELRILPTGQLLLRDTGGTATKVSSSTNLTTGRWYLIEVYTGTEVGVNDAGYELKIDGISQGSGTNGNVGTLANYYVAFGNYTRRSAQSAVFYYDNIVMCDENPYVGTYDWARNFAGPNSIVRLDPDGNGTYTSWNWTYTAADDLETNTTWNTTDYNDNNALGGNIYETHTLEDTDGLGIDELFKIHAVKTFTIAKTQAGANTHYVVRSRNLGTNDDTSGVNPGANYDLFGQVYNYTTPFGAAADTDWDKDDVDSLETGCGANNFTVSVYRMTACGAMLLLESSTVAGDYTPHAGI